jgi:hypothetical protein
MVSPIREKGASFIVVPPNGARYGDPDVIRRLESYIRKRLPDHDIEVAWVVQPRIETFTVVERDSRDREVHAKDAILGVLERFDPDAPELEPD